MINCVCISVSLCVYWCVCVCVYMCGEGERLGMYTHTESWKRFQNTEQGESGGGTRVWTGGSALCLGDPDVLRGVCSRCDGSCWENGEREGGR